MDPIKLFKRYAVYLQIPREVTQRIVRWYHVQRNGRSLLGCHELLKRNCTQLKYYIRAKLDGLKCTHREPWLSVTRAGFPKLFSGLQTMSQQVLLIFTSLHKVFKPQHPSELPKEAITDRISDVVSPYSGSKRALSDALSLIEIGTRHLMLSEFDDYSMDSGTIYDPNHEVQPDGLSWLHAFYKENEYWLAPCDASSCFYPYNPTNEPEVRSEGRYTFLTREGNVSSLYDPSFKMLGEYQLSPEPGNKARTYFACNLLIQATAQPLFRFFESIEKKCGWSVRYLETEAKVSTTMSWLQAGDVVSSVDQTSATDRFPRQLQLFTAWKLGVPPEWIRFISKTAQGIWNVSDSLRPWFSSNTIKLAVGQPMGLSYSMPLYTLSMIALLRGACARWGYSPDFLVLGDDLVIRDSGLAQWCHDFLPKIGVKISPTKGVTSSNLAEFAGAYITKDAFAFPGKIPVVDEKSWYACSVMLNQPLPDGCPKGVTKDALQEAFWLSRVAALGCYGALSCPVKNSMACNTIIQQHGLTEAHLDLLLSKYLEYDIQRIGSSCNSIVGQLNKGLITSKSDAICRMIHHAVDNRYLMDVLAREDDLLRKGFKMTVSRVAYQLHDVIGASGGSGFESWLKPKGHTTQEWVTYVLTRVAAILKLDAPNWNTKYSRLAQRLLVSALSELLECLREYVWERRAPSFKRVIARSSSFCHFLSAS